MRAARFTRPFTITFTEEQYCFLKEMADEFQTSVADTVRHLIYEGIVAGEEPEEVKDEKEEA